MVWQYIYYRLIQTSLPTASLRDSIQVITNIDTKDGIISVTGDEIFDYFPSLRGVFGIITDRQFSRQSLLEVLFPLQYVLLSGFVHKYCEFMMDINPGAGLLCLRPQGWVLQQLVRQAVHRLFIGRDDLIVLSIFITVHHSVLDEWYNVMVTECIWVYVSSDETELEPL